MRSRGVVREWSDEEGWGVVDSEDTPGGCWVHYSAVRTPGFKTLSPGEAVTMVVTAASQDGFDYRGEAVWPRNSEPADGRAVVRNPTAYSSSVTISFDPPVERDG